MKAKNKKDRLSSFLKFVALFIVTVSMILTAVYFNFEIPEKENELLRNQIEAVINQNEYQKDFFNEMIVLRQMIDSLGTPGQNIDYENSQISLKIVELEKNIPPKSTSHIFDMHTSITKLLADLQEAKKKSISLQESESTIADYKLAYENCKRDLTQVQNELYIARRTN